MSPGVFLGTVRSLGMWDRALFLAVNRTKLAEAVEPL